jgi:hypothetical protein
VLSQPSVDETSEQIPRESVSEQQRFREAMLVDGGQLKRLAGFQAETTFLWERRHHVEPTPSAGGRFR